MRSMDELIIAVSESSTDLKLVTQNAKRIVWSGPYNICNFAEDVTLADTEENMKTLEDGIKRYEDILHIYEFMHRMTQSKKEHFHLKDFEEFIRQSRNPKLMFYCLTRIPGIDFEAMLESLYETKCVKYIEKLGQEEYEISENEKISVETLPNYQQKLKEAREYDYFPYCLEPFGTRDVNQLIPLVTDTKSPYLITELADYIEYLRDYKNIFDYDPTPLQRELILCATKEPLYIYEYAASISSSDKKSAQVVLIEQGDPKYMYYLYKYVPDVDKEELRKQIDFSGNEKYRNKIGLSK